MPLDESLRERLKVLADSEALPQLEARARARVEVNALAEFERRERGRFWGLGLVTMGALAAVSVWLAQPSGLVPDVGARVAGRTTAPAQREEAEVAPRAPLECVEHAGAQWVARTSGGHDLDLGTRALLHASEDTQVVHEFSASCDVRATLSEGSVAVHARDLRGGRLVISTPHGDVVVKGTVFEVTSTSGELHVAVVEGLVEVRLQDGQVLEVAPGRSLSIGDRVTRKELPLAARNALRMRVGLAILVSSAPAATETTLNFDEQDGAAEAQAWRAGSLNAPRVVPEPGWSLTEDGRPMLKPRVSGKDGGLR